MSISILASVLPSSRSRSSICLLLEKRAHAMKRLDLLKQVTFGAQVAEDEVNALESYFVETNEWARMIRGEIDIVRGEKGAGKSAIYSLLIRKSGEFFDDNIILVAAESPRGTTVFRDLSADPPTTEVEFIALWKLYTLAIVAQQLREYDVRGTEIEKVYRALEEARLLEREFTLTGVLRGVHDYARRIVRAEAYEGGMQIDPATQMPSGITGKIVLREPSHNQKQLGIFSIDGLFDIINKVLYSTYLNVWVLFDRLDVAFADDHKLEGNALRALIRTYSDLKSFDHISLKIFLREDIWKGLVGGGFRELSHIVRYVVLDWTPQSLLNLLIRRILSNHILVQEFSINSKAVLEDYERQERLFYQLFPDQVEQGPQKAKTFNWLITRCRDGTSKTAPRELIHLANSILEQEIKRLERGGSPTTELQLFDRSVFKSALPIVSNMRLHAYLYAEYPNEKEFVSKLEGEKAEQTPESLCALWNVDRDAAISKAKELATLGLFEERGTREQPTFWVPFLYRDALNLVQGRAESED